MNKSLPDKWVRKAIYDAINNMLVSGTLIKCYDTRTTGPNVPNNYVLLTTQTNTVDKANKCEWRWESSILLDVFTRRLRSGNPGSRVLVDDVLDEVRNRINSLALDGGSGLTIVRQTQSFPNDITDSTENEIVHRKFLRLELSIN